MVGLGVDFRPSQPPCHLSLQAASETLLKMVAFIGTPSTNIFALSCIHAHLLVWLLSASDSVEELAKKWWTWRGSEPSVTLVGRRDTIFEKKGGIGGIGGMESFEDIEVLA
jgi:hypothetical protein